MLKLYTKIEQRPLAVRISLSDRTMILGSCFADNMGERMVSGGFDAMVNPFGTLYNPSSIASSIERLDSCTLFTPGDCVQMGAGADQICSFHHHTSFARYTVEEFLENANSKLMTASEFWHKATKVCITLGTAFVWRRAENGQVVANCLKRPGSEFRRDLLSVSECSSILDNIVRRHPDKEFIFTVSPIRHLGDGAHSNTISKSTLHLALDSLQRTTGQCYFPAYEIILDELRDYRFYADDLVHPSKLAADAVWERFLECAVPSYEHETIRINAQAAKRMRHMPFRQ